LSLFLLRPRGRQDNGTGCEAGVLPRKGLAMPYVLNRYVIPLVAMSVLAAALFIVIVYVLVFPYQDRVKEYLDKQKELSDCDSKRREVSDINAKFVALCGGDAGDPGSATLKAISERVKNSTTMRALANPEASKPEMLPDYSKKPVTAGGYMQALEKNCDYLMDQVTRKDDKVKTAEGSLRDLNLALANLYISVILAPQPQYVAKPETLPKPADILNDKTKSLQQLLIEIRNTTGDLRNKVTNLEKANGDLATDNKNLKEENGKISATYENDRQRLTKERDDVTVERDKFKIAAEDYAAKLRKAQEDLAAKERAKEGQSTLVTGAVNESLENKPAGKIFMIQGIGTEALGAIDIGAKKFARPGMVFRVLRDGVEKGRVQLYKVDDNASYFRVLSLAKAHDPILQNDDVASPFYRNGQPVPSEFVLIGEFPEPLTKEKIIDRIKEWGGSVADKVTANTKYVILGQGPISDEVRSDLLLYSSAQRISLATVKEFFGE